MLKPNIKKRALHRVKILEGQIKGLARAIEEEKYCIDVLQYSLSIQKSLKSLDALLLENHLDVHVKHQMCRKNEVEKAVRELLRIYTLSNK